MNSQLTARNEMLCLPPSPPPLQSLLERRLQQEDGSVLGRSALLLDQMQVVSVGNDVITLQLLRLRTLAPVSVVGGEGEEVVGELAASLDVCV